MNIPSEDFSDVTLAIDDMLEVVMGVVDMDVDKLADEVTDMVVDRTDFTDVILVLWLWYV